VASHEVRVAPIPAWVDHERLLGPSEAGVAWQISTDAGGERGAQSRLGSEAAADLGARLRGVGLAGRALSCTIEPPLQRSMVRRARTEDARRRRATTPGFERAGVRLDAEGRWSLTPESLGLRIARAARGAPIVDAGCGLGGNSIAFARTGCRVIAIEANAERLALARHNAGVYGVRDRIEFIHGDAVAYAAGHADRRAIVFVDPPWGTDWDRTRCALDELPLLAALLPIAAQGYAALWAKVPPSFATDQLREAAAEAVFGEGPGDHRRIKFLLLRQPPPVDIV